MDQKPRRSLPQKISKYIQDSFANLSSFLLNKTSEEENIFYTPTNSLENTKVSKSKIEDLDQIISNSFEESLDWSKDNLLSEYTVKKTDINSDNFNQQFMPERSRNGSTDSLHEIQTDGCKETNNNSLEYLAENLTIRNDISDEINFDDLEIKDSLLSFRNGTNQRRNTQDIFSNSINVTRDQSISFLHAKVQDLELRLKDKESREEEYKRLLEDLDATISYIIEKEETHNKDVYLNIIKEKTNIIDKLNSDIDRYDYNEKKYKDHISFLERDLMNSQERSDAYRCIASEKITILETERNKLRENLDIERKKIESMCKKIDHLEKMVSIRSEEGIELVEYCKYLLKNHQKIDF
ncbi:hypothetical protein CWI38_0041p0030 [Hamiltosporidium tvaerminnensis]|uniref:Transforming acidic coiled-coil-containing protein C-terminal domain-containing protein n=1 Tax=Hamiltosporidium tvaerminnensis TaxID=1176355 RepID=A0A4Q9L975_9MICR|nr:hypothetical protein CWI37_0314p0010 [Hamiltosporidium tvaerminnensis]TBU20638.1 hypothetical protein CWI38_0041p0030 [Hamiltosporidium tvaerminnensis]